LQANCPLMCRCDEGGGRPGEEESPVTEKKRRRTVSPEKARAAAMGIYAGPAIPAEPCCCGGYGKDRTGNKSSGGKGAACETKQRAEKGGE
jgi:hypothetical protein